jgi:hypothetical protein
MGANLQSKVACSPSSHSDLAQSFFHSQYAGNFIIFKFIAIILTITKVSYKKKFLVYVHKVRQCDDNEVEEEAES